MEGLAIDLSHVPANARRRVLEELWSRLGVDAQPDALQVVIATHSRSNALEELAVALLDVGAPGEPPFRVNVYALGPPIMTYLVKGQKLVEFGRQGPG